MSSDLGHRPVLDGGKLLARKGGDTVSCPWEEALPAETPKRMTNDQ
jgi:hypothetical protein